ncbi:MAG: beta-ketoacyl-[acyl-carrier-protein] synthase family protein [Nevskiales bacterium]
MQALRISHYSLTTALGRGAQAQRRALLDERSGLTPCTDFGDAQLPAWIGRVAGLEDSPLPKPLAAFECRNNRLAWLGLQQDGLLEAVAALRQRIGAQRIGLFLGTSTSGVYQTELAYHARNAAGELPEWYSYPHTQNCYSVGYFVRTALELTGPSLVISTACSSSAKVFACAARYIQAGLIDAAVVGGVDSLCLTTLYGFSALQLVSPQPCRPADAARDGISIGEAAGFAVLEKDAGPGVRLLGYGESSDAHHMSAPDPEGAGALLSMQRALNRAGLAADEIDYINLHGTATQANDLSEGKAVHRLFGTRVPGSSTKAWTGHCLGAAGIVETLFCALALEHGFAPKSLNTHNVDAQIPNQILLQTRRQPQRYALTNSFGFGGSNCSLILGKAA